MEHSIKVTSLCNYRSKKTKAFNVHLMHLTLTVVKKKMLAVKEHRFTCSLNLPCVPVTFLIFLNPVETRM